MLDHAVLVDRQPVPSPDIKEWATWMIKVDRHVAVTDTADGHHVSTVFLGTDHQWGHGPPLWFETMIFPACDYCVRTSTWEEAEQAHKEAVASLSPSPDSPPPY